MNHTTPALSFSQCSHASADSFSSPQQRQPGLRWDELGPHPSPEAPQMPYKSSLEWDNRSFSSPWTKADAALGRGRASCLWPCLADGGHSPTCSPCP